MTIKRFQSGHEVLEEYVSNYSPSESRAEIYRAAGRNTLSGNELGESLLSDLREALRVSKATSPSEGVGAPTL